MNRIIYFLAAVLMFTGCYEDNSSKKYEPIGTITVSGIESSYTAVALADELNITPIVTSSDPGDNVEEFEYLWTYHISKTSAPYPIDTLHQYTKDIVDWDMDITPGTYILTLKVTNPRQQDYSVYKTASLTVSTTFSNGYYFLKETADGNTEMDFLSEDGKYATDLIETRTGAPIIGKPTRLSQFHAYTYPDPETAEVVTSRALFAMGGRDMKVFRPTDMALINDHTSIFYDGVKPDEKPLFGGYSASSGNHMWFSSRGGYYYPTSYASSGKTGHPIAPEGVCGFTGGTAIYVVTYTRYVLFDDLNDRLVIYDQSGNLLSVSSDNGLSPTRITHHLLFIGTSGWAVFEDDVDPSVRYLYQINPIYSTIITTPILEIRKLDPETTPNFLRADVYGSSKSVTKDNYNTTTLYAGVGDKLYVYSTGTSTERLVSPTGIGSGEQITMITHKTLVPNPKNPSDTSGLLMIGTHKDSRYKVYMYKLTGDVPDGEPALIAEGVGKVVDMQCANPAVNMRQNTFY